MVATKRQLQMPAPFEPPSPLKPMRDACAVSAGQALTAFRRAAKLSQAEVGAVLGLSQSRISKVERGLCPLSVPQLMRLAPCLKVPTWKVVKEADRLAESKRRADRKAAK